MSLEAGDILDISKAQVKIGGRLTKEKILAVLPSRHKWAQNHYRCVVSLNEFHSANLKYYTERYMEIANQTMWILESRDDLKRREYVTLPEEVGNNHENWVLYINTTFDAAKQAEQAQNWLLLQRAELKPYEEAWKAFWDSVEYNESTDGEDPVMQSALTRLGSCLRRFNFLTDSFSRVLPRLHPLWGARPEWVEWDNAWSTQMPERDQEGVEEESVVTELKEKLESAKGRGIGELIEKFEEAHEPVANFEVG